MNLNDDDSNTDWMIDDESNPAAPAADTATPAPWKVLIVDDDVDVHVVTKFSLSNACFMGRRLCFLHAYSGDEALTVLRNSGDVALVLLDVIMETSDAGLRVARQIREELDNQLVRIVLRTGQPGQALEHSIILDYDINDFWCKTDLTTRKLFTTVISSLRGYANLLAARQRSDALAAALARSRQLLAALDQHAMLMAFNRHGKITELNDKLCTTLQYSREELLGQGGEALLPQPWPAEQQAAALAALARGEPWSDVVGMRRRDGELLKLQLSVTPTLDADGKPSQYIALATPV
ncbi:PAS domain-containing protein [Rugamonas sp. CCM 8940]|uniref:PAS domain-containing protein n=1 Tax=Rugamonas sp. CCM 8940 TaxID=2765359 RepID=UPI0018F520CD|nr:PAS domain-containing protein [Rugamonas sp. CCM 8940]MBJ7312614.1 PAS domain-containing protein [Rugamonas sp. CCM 8940]